MKIPGWFIFFCTGMMMPGCQCSHPAEVTTNGEVKTEMTATPVTNGKYDHPSVIPGGDMVLSAQMEKNLVANFEKYLYAPNEGRYEDQIDGYYKPMLDIYNRDTLVRRLRDTALKTGWKNIVLSHDIDKITPVVDMDSVYIVSLRARILLDIVVSEQYEGNLVGMEGSVKSKYPSAVFDEANRTFHVNEKMKFYCLTRKDTLDFHFLVDSYFNDPKLANLIDKEHFVKVRSYE